MSMKIVKNLLWSLMCLTFVVSCSEAPTDEPNKPDNGVIDGTKDSRIKLDQNEVSVGVDGGTCTVTYTILNPKDNTKVEATSTQPWVKDFKLNTEGAIRFTVEPNDGEGAEPRECLVEVSYRYADPVVFKVKQSARINKSFSLENITANYFDLYIDIIPEDKTTPYIVMSASPEYIIASGFKTGQDFYEDDVAYFAWMGSFYGQSAAQIMQEKAKVGDVRGQKVGKGSPGVTYTIYCYYIDYTTGALISDVCLMPVKTASPKLSDVEFTMSRELVDGCMASVDVTPIGYDGDYYFDVLPKALVDSYLYELVDLEGKPYLNSVEEVIEYWWSNAVGEMVAEGVSTTQIIADYTCVGTNSDGTPRSHFDFELLAEVEYYLFAYTMEENGLCSSVPQVELFKTEPVAKSDNEITIAVDKVTARTAQITFTPSNNDYYVAGWEKASDWAKYGNNDAEIMEYLLHNIEYALLKGPEAVSVLDLEPDTEYVVYAFGSRGGCATTSQIFSQRITTKSGGEGSVNISVKDLGYYDAADLATFEGYEFFGGEYYSGAAILPVEIEFDSEDHGDWSFDIYNWTGRHESEYYNDKQYIDGLVYNINTEGCLTTTKTYSILEFGGKYMIVAVVLDSDGAFSKLYKRWVEPTYDGVGDPEVYVNWWNEYQDSLNYDDPVEGEGDEVVETQSLVVDSAKLFSKKVKANKMSTTSFKAEQSVPEIDEIVAR